VNEKVGDYVAAILVENNNHNVFDDLDVQNSRRYARTVEKQDRYVVINDSAKSYGIHILNSQNGTMHNFTFRNLIIRNVYSIKKLIDSNQKDFNAFTPAGIKIEATKNTDIKIGTIKDVIVENCLFVNLHHLGVHIKHNSGGGQVFD